jgi:hypothetical protein
MSRLPGLQGLIREAAVTGTDYSSNVYSSSLSLPMTGGMDFSLSASAFNSTTNSTLSAGGGTSFTYAGASVGASVSRPLSLFRNERVLTEGGRWLADIPLQDTRLNLEEARRSVVNDASRIFF